MRRSTSHFVLGAALLAAACSSDTPAQSIGYEGDEAGECEDGADNDQDELFDCKDPGCAGAPVCSSDEADGSSPGPDATHGTDTPQAETTGEDVPDPPPDVPDTGAPVVTGQNPCPPLGEPEGNIIEVEPGQAAGLQDILAAAPAGSTVLFEDGTYNVNGDIWTPWASFAWKGCWATRSSASFRGCPRT